MKRQVSLEDISDGRLYGKNDMVRVGCNDCRGCSSCCSQMGNSVILDPMDIFRLTVQLSLTFEELMRDRIELNVVDGVILPNLKMSTGTEVCGFLDDDGRCSIHPYRPGVCRLFPLGRYYEDAEDACIRDETAVDRRESRKLPFHYFLQVHECPAPCKTKVKVAKWLDTPGLDRYEWFVADWHWFLEDVQKRLEGETDEGMKNINLFILKLFYIRPYDGTRDFYSQFEERMTQAREVLEL